MGMLKEATEQGVQIGNLPPKIHCTVFEDNSSAQELARLLEQHLCKTSPYDPLPPGTVVEKNTLAMSRLGILTCGAYQNCTFCDARREYALLCHFLYFGK